jgi:hypothetical protein
MPVLLKEKPVTAVAIETVTGRDAWEELFSRVEHPFMVQSWAYGEAKQAAVGWKSRRVVSDAGGWRARRLVFEREGEPVAIAQVLDKPVAGVRLASRLNRGPLFLDPEPSAEAVRDVFLAVRRRWQRFRGVLVLAPALPRDYEDYLTLAELGFRDRHLHGWKGARVDLRPDEDQLLKNLAPTWRNRLRSSLRSGLTLSVSQAPEDVDWMVARHADNMRDKDFTGPSPALVRALREASPDDFLVFRAHLGDEVVGGMGVFTFSHTAEYYVGWFGPGGRKVNVSNFMYWEIALEMKRRGFSWFDLGGIELANVGHFKRGMRGQEYELLNEWLAF